MSDLLQSHEGGVMTLTLNRPERRNAIGEPQVRELIAALQRGADDPTVRCVALTGADGTFSVGGDISTFQPSEPRDGQPAPPQMPMAQMLRQMSEAARLLHEMPKPTLAVINGACAGAGLALAMACDLRFCLDSAKLTTAFAAIGLSGDCGGSYFLPKLVGRAKARELAFTAETITGSDALDIGLVTKVADAATFAEASRAYAEQLASLPTVAIGLIKKNLNASDDTTVSDVFDIEAANMALAARTHDHRAAAAAFMKKEKVVFEGR